ncbi:MAG TPA: 16S rRNA (adenine(1518)-N(6)/adenine(1519)-N(6))-dimethyltransferase RsmA [Verrucomicrobiae bacterium]|jgi:16S rRNA (adenine1518-N6/adenine1519-N6)-dimethyltransferase
MTLTQMREILTAHGIQLTKSLGQNFLHDVNQLRRIVEAAELSASDRVLEIGPGLGPLTELLLDRAAHVLALELDERFVEILRQNFSGNPKLEVRHKDALAFVRHQQRDWGGWKLVANLPYSVASPVLVELAQAEHPPERMTVTLQLEVAQRLAATAGDDDFGVLTLLVQLTFAPAGMFKISPECFFPAPDVVSACLTLLRRPEPLLPRELHGSFTRIVKRAFSQRRKMMLKLLRTDWPGERLEAAFTTLKISPQARAETVSLENFVELTRMLTAHSTSA